MRVCLLGWGGWGARVLLAVYGTCKPLCGGGLGMHVKLRGRWAAHAALEQGGGWWAGG